MTELAPLPVAIPMLVAAIILGTSPFLTRWLADVLAIATSAAVTAICLVLVHGARQGTVIHWFGGWTPHGGTAVGIAFAIDPIGAGGAALAGLIVMLALIVIWRRLDVHGPLFHSLMLVILSAMCGFCLTADLFNMFVFFELMSVSAFALTALRNEERGALQGALGFAVVNSIGAFMVLSGIALLYARTGALNLAEIGRRLSASGTDRLVICAFTLIAVGFLVKAAIVPFHFWLADAATVAPTPLCMVLAATLDTLGLYAIARIYWTVFAGAVATGGQGASIRGVLVGLGVLSAVVGAVMCLCQRHLKRLLAFALVSHSGLLLLAIALLSSRGIAAFAVYAVADGLVKASLFAAAGAVGRGRGSFDLERLAGPGMRGAAILLAAGGLALAGMPPFGTATAKALLEDAFRAGHDGWLTMVALAASVLTAAAVLRTVPRVWTGAGAAGADAPRSARARRSARSGEEPGPDELVTAAAGTPVALYGASIALLTLVVALGFTSGFFQNATLAATRFVDQPAYAALVLDGHRILPPTPSSPVIPTGVPLGFAAAAGAIAIAAAAERWTLRRGPLPAWLGSPVRTLRDLHTGRLGDAVMWLTVGTAIFGGLLAVAPR